MAFTENQIAQLSAPLDRRHVKSRQQAGRNLSYIEGWHAIAEANRIFGFDNWTRETVDLRCVVERETKLRSGADAWRVAYICKARVIVDIRGDAVSREGTGYGSGIDQDLGAAHESAAKEAETDAMKRALMTFGSQFGLALYDKTQAEVSDSLTKKLEGRPRVPESEVSAPHLSEDLPQSQVTAGASVPLPACIPVGGHGESIWNEINAATMPPTINTILAGNATKFRRWSETPEGAAVVAAIEKRAEDRKMEMGA